MSVFTVSADMSNVRALERKADPSIVILLENLLADAVSGKVIGVVVLSNDADGYRRWNAGYWTQQEALYLFEHWKHDVLIGGDK